MALGGAMQGSAAYNAAANKNYYGSYSGTYSGSNMYGAHYSGNVGGSYEGRIHDPAAGLAAQEMVNRRTVAQMNEVNELSAQNIQATADQAFKKQTIQPGDIHGGIIYFDVGGYGSEKRRLTIEVNFNNEIHTFQVDAHN